MAFRDVVDPAEATDPDSRAMYKRIRRESGKIPGIYRVRAFADSSRWLKILDSSIFRWPQSCSIDDKTRELVGLAKSVVYSWEPGVLTNIEGALEAGASSDEIVETIVLTSVVIGLADVERVFRAVPTDFAPAGQQSVIGQTGQSAPNSAGSSEKALYDFAVLHALTPMMVNPDWVSAIHQSTKMRYERRILDERTRALVCLAASAAKCWNEGIREHLAMALGSGATKSEIVDVLASVYKTRASIAVQMGFSVPCSIPEMQGFKVLNDYYSQRRRKKRPRAGSR